jgi:hypothetical protein
LEAVPEKPAEPALVPPALLDPLAPFSEPPAPAFVALAPLLPRIVPALLPPLGVPALAPPFAPEPPLSLPELLPHAATTNASKNATLHAADLTRLKFFELMLQPTRGPRASALLE